LAASAADGRVVRRAQALLWLHAGEPLTAVARRLGLSRQTLYGVVTRYYERAAQPVEQRLQDAPRPGRPDPKRQLAAQSVEALLSHSPSRYGYRAQHWTIPMLLRQIEVQHQVRISHDTLARALRDLDYCYKRPRYVLARRDPQWRQVKGGSCGASKPAGAR
jgi:transposase